MNNEMEMIAVKLGALFAPLRDLCECLREPCDAFPFVYRGSISQLVTCHVATNVFQVPPGQTGVITSITFAERYPGTLYGASFTLLVNNNFHPAFPRTDHPVGTGMERGVKVRICLEEQDTVSVLLQCSWTPVQFDGIAGTYVQTLFPFEIRGYYQLKKVA